MGKLDEKTPLGSAIRGLKYNIKMIFKDLGCEGVDWRDLAEVKYK